MRRSLSLLLTSLVLAPIAMVIAPRAHAEDAPDDTSAAAKAYRDAWWAETAGGNLAQAVDLYAKVADAEGPASVKARALYRRAVVLQRIGKTEDAIRTLERLAKDYAGEAALQADARARLAEWTAVDLKTSFAEWYRRYQYSPEFQAKIVDLVLKLGAPDPGVSGAASNEILTIGAPAIPALRQHVDSPNGTLRERVVPALLELGEIPSLDALRRTTTWRNYVDTWATLRAAPAEVRARLRAEAKADQPWDQGLLALIEGPVAFLTWANTPAAKDVVDAFLSNGGIWDLKDSDPAALRPVLVALVENRALSERARSGLVTRLHALQAVDLALAEKWARTEERLLRQWAVAFLVDPRGGASSWAALRRLLPIARKWTPDSTRSSLFRGVLSGLDAMPAGDELDRLADDLISIASDFGSLSGLSAAARVVVARMVDRIRDPDVAAQLFQVWQRPGGGSETDIDRLAGWVRSAPFDTLRQLAAQVLVSVSNGGEQRALALLGEEDLAPRMRFQIFDLLLRSNHPGSLLAEAPARRAVLAAVRRQDGDGREDGQRRYVGRFLEMASRAPPEARRAAAEEWLADPLSYPRSLLRDEYATWGIAEYVRVPWGAAMTSLRPEFQKAWASWTPAQRDAAVESLGAIHPADDPALTAFLAASARDGANGVSRASRAALLDFADAVTLGDLRQAFDLSTPDGTDDAIRFLRATSAKKPPPSELFDALKLGFRPDGDEKTALMLLTLYQGDARVYRRLIEALLAHHETGVQENAVGALTARESSDDLPLWLVALALPDVEARVRAATGLGRVAHPDATKALVKALDDPNSQVRDAAIASLEAIKRIEDLKAQWREKVR